MLALGHRHRSRSLAAAGSAGASSELVVSSVCTTRPVRTARRGGAQDVRQASALVRSTSPATPTGCNAPSVRAMQASSTCLTINFSISFLTPSGQHGVLENRHIPRRSSKQSQPFCSASAAVPSAGRPQR